MWTEEFEIALHGLSLSLPECELDELGLDDPDILDIQGLCVPLSDVDGYDYDTVPGSLTFQEV